MKLRAAKGEARASEEEFRKYSAGLVCLTGGEDGPLARAFSRGDAKDTLEKLAGIYGARNVYAELQRHMHRDEEARNQAVIDLARSRGFPLLATNGVLHAAPRERELMDVLTCVHHKTTIREAGRLLHASLSGRASCADPGEVSEKELIRDRGAGRHRPGGAG